MHRRKRKDIARALILLLLHCLSGCSAISNWQLVNDSGDTIRVSIQFTDREYFPEDIEFFKINGLLDNDVGTPDLFTLFSDTPIPKHVNTDKAQRTVSFDLAPKEYAFVLLSDFAPANRVSVRIQGPTGKFTAFSGAVAQAKSAYIDASHTLLTKGTACTPVYNAYRCVTKVRADMLTEGGG